MAFKDPSSIPDSREQKWVDQIRKIMEHQLKIDLQIPSVSIFQVPEIITKTKPEAYEPQQIGLGPNHHFRQLPYKKMEQKKLAVVQRVLLNHKINDFKVVLDKVQKLVPVVRACYDMFLQDDDDSLAWVFAIDGLYLLAQFHFCNCGMDNEKERYELPHKKESHEHKISMEVLLAQDIMMAENQIPFKVLEEIDTALHSSSGNSSYTGNKFSPSIFRSFSEIHSPFELCSLLQAPNSVEHLLDYMYHSIINNVKAGALPPTSEAGALPPTSEAGASPSYTGQELFSPLIAPTCVNVPHHSSVNKVKAPPTSEPVALPPSGVASTSSPSAEQVEGSLPFISKIPFGSISQCFGKAKNGVEELAQPKPATRPASKLWNKAGFEFHFLRKDKGIWKIDSEKKQFHLTRVTLNNNSEVTLRNLVAYETLTAKSDNFPLTEYVVLMCGLIVNKDDVKILRENEIIDGSLRDDGEVAKLFTDMSSSIQNMKTKGNSELQRKIDKVNKVYESRRRMLPYKLLKKLAKWLLWVLNKIHRWLVPSWKIVAFMVSIAVVFMLTLQAYCEVFGCNKTKVTLVPAGSQ